MPGATATWEEASHCPKCGSPGNDVQQERIRSGRCRGGVAHILQCENEHCRWFNTRWVVAVDKDNNIPVRARGPKEYEDLSPAMESLARRQIEQLAIDDPTARADVQKFLADNGLL